MKVAFFTWPVVVGNGSLLFVIPYDVNKDAVAPILDGRPVIVEELEEALQELAKPAYSRSQEASWALALSSSISIVGNHGLWWSGSGITPSQSHCYLCGGRGGRVRARRSVPRAGVSKRRRQPGVCLARHTYRIEFTKYKVSVHRSEREQVGKPYNIQK